MFRPSSKLSYPKIVLQYYLLRSTWGRSHITPWKFHKKVGCLLWLYYMMVVLLYIYWTIHYSASSNHQTIHLSKTKPNIYKYISSTKEDHLQADCHPQLLCPPGQSIPKDMPLLLRVYRGWGFQPPGHWQARCLMLRILTLRPLATKGGVIIVESL